jgi:hypothetical protein
MGRGFGLLGLAGGDATVSQPPLPMVVKLSTNARAARGNLGTVSYMSE